MFLNTLLYYLHLVVNKSWILELYLFIFDLLNPESILIHYGDLVVPAFTHLLVIYKTPDLIHLYNESRIFIYWWSSGFWAGSINSLGPRSTYSFVIYWSSWFWINIVTDGTCWTSKLHHFRESFFFKTWFGLKIFLNSKCKQNEWKGRRKLRIILSLCWS